MEKALKIVSLVGVIMGALAIIASIADQDTYAFIGGALFLAQGWLSLSYMEKYK